MIYTARLQYSIKVDAINETDAFQKAVAIIRANPSVAIASVQPGVAPTRRRSLIGRMVFGY
jgi:hypothetical protein